MSQGRIAALALAAGFGTAVLMGCGIDTKSAGEADTSPATVTQSTSSTTSTTGGTTADDRRAAAAKKLPKRPAGVVAVEGPARGSLTPQAIRGVQGVQVNYAATDADQGFDDFCRGKIDILDASRRPTRGELRLCRRMGIELDRPDDPGRLRRADRGHPQRVRRRRRLPAAVDGQRHLPGRLAADQLEPGRASSTCRCTPPAARRRHRPSSSSPRSRSGCPPTPRWPTSAATTSSTRTDDGVRREVTRQAKLKAIRDRYRQRITDLELERRIAFQDHVDPRDQPRPRPRAAPDRGARTSAARTRRSR